MCYDGAKEVKRHVPIHDGRGRETLRRDGVFTGDDITFRRRSLRPQRELHFLCLQDGGGEVKKKVKSI